MFIHWHLIMGSANVRRAEPKGTLVTSKVSSELHAFSTSFVLAMIAISFAPLSWAQDTNETPEHVIGEQPYPFDTVDPRVKERPAIELPDSVAPKLGLLTAAEIEAGKFFRSPIRTRCCEGNLFFRKQ